MQKTILLVLGAGTLVLLAGCASAPKHRPNGTMPGAYLLTHYDFNHDGAITRGEMEKGIRQDFAKADTNGDGRLDETEVRAVNQKRWAQEASSTSPLVDWNHDGYVDFDEFAAAPRSLFDQLDEDNNGVVSKEELRPLATPHRRGKARGRLLGLPGGGGSGDTDSDSD